VITADENPFRVARIEALAYRAPDFTWDDFLAQLSVRSFRGAIVGPHGSGKTTLLLETQARLEATGMSVHYGFLNDETPHKHGSVAAILREIPEDALLFLDGAEQLDAFTWQWLRWRARRLRGFVITTHTPGRLPTIYTARSQEVVFRALLSELDPDKADSQWPRAKEHFRTCSGNMREAFFALYDDCARGDG
jgi:hypothetical protein